MTRARVLLAAAVASLVAVSSFDAAAAAPEPAPVTAPSTAPDPSAVPPTAPVDDEPGSEVVVLHTDTGGDAQSDTLRDAIERLGATVRHTFGDQKTISLQLPAGSDPTSTSTAESLAELPGVARVEPPVTRTFGAVPNDPQLSSQRRYLDAVAAPAAWDRQRGSAAVKIAIVDSGVDVGHPDLVGKIAGRYNAVTRSTSVTDTVGHGTFVAGVAAANTNNRTGVSGAGYKSSILAVKVADKFGDIAIDDEIAGIRWAADHGAKIINLSLSGPDSSTAELRAVQYAQRKGALVVAAAGNEGDTTRQYPAAYPGVIAVAATDVARGRRASFSSHGPWVTLAAPGVNLLSTAPRTGSDYFPSRSGYARGDGTSFSSPLVAGEAALLAAANPAMTSGQLRTALVASSHGYAGNDVGRGQVDFNLALDHVLPTTKPVTVVAVGTAGSIGLTSVSSAPRVSFRVDNGPWLPSVPVTLGTASLPFSSYGYANSSHTVQAVNCSKFGECNTSAPLRGSTFSVANSAPSLTVDGKISGPFTATASGPSSGGVQLLIDGKQAAFDATAPFEFDVNGSLYDNRKHDLTVQSCTVSRSLCQGPASTPTAVTFNSLHPSITGLSRTAISPNRDGSGDTALLTFRPDGSTDTARVSTRTAAGVEVNSEPVPSGTSYLWRGLDSAGRKLPDASYRLALVTTSYDGQRRGLAERAVVVDTQAPRLRAVSGHGVRFFPHRDGYLDTFAPSAALPDGAVFTLTISTTTGRLVRALQTVRGPAARVAIGWNGRTASGRQAAAGLYRWTLTAADAAGNITRSGSYRIALDARRLQTRTVSVVGHARAKVRGTARCATKIASSYRRGAHLINRCRGGDGEVSYANYSIKVPSALRYQRITFAAFGRSTRTSQLSASFRRVDGGLEVPRAAKVKRSSARWRTIASVPAAGHLSRGKINVALVVGSKYGGTNDFDARSVRLRVRLVRLV